MANVRLHPSTDDKRRWQPWRDRRYYELLPELVSYLKLELFIYQRQFLVPPKPWDYDELELVMLSGAKRIGKTFVNALRVLPYIFMPGAEVRLYGPTHELCTREFDWIKRFIFGPRDGPCLVQASPKLRSSLIDFSDKPKNGLMMQWSWGSRVMSKSMMPNDDDWVGEAIDLGLICEPGKFTDLQTTYFNTIHPNLDDRKGMVSAAGTVDQLGMKDLHDVAHDIDEYPRHYCFCEVPRWANTELFVDPATGKTMSDEQIKARILQARRAMAWREFSINWLGLWSIHTKTALEQWNPETVVKLVPTDVHKALVQCPQGWIEFLGMDTGQFLSCGHYIASPEGRVYRVQEWVNYERRGSVEEVYDSRGFGVFLARIRADLGGRALTVFGDPTSQFKNDVMNTGFGWEDAINDHGVTVANFNEYLSQKKFRIVRPIGSPQTMLEVEAPRLRWSEITTGSAAKPTLDKKTRGHAVDECRYGLSMHPIAPARDYTRPYKNWVQEDIANVMARVREQKDFQPMFDDMPAMGGM